LGLIGRREVTKPSIGAIPAQVLRHPIVRNVGVHAAFVIKVEMEWEQFRDWRPWCYDQAVEMSFYRKLDLQT
jgi:hypothetical protein